MRPFLLGAALLASLILLQRAAAQELRIPGPPPSAEPGQAGPSPPPAPPTPAPPSLLPTPDAAAGHTDLCPDGYLLDGCDAETFTRKRLTFQFLAGAQASKVGLGPNDSPRFDFAPIDLRLGCVLWSPWPERGWLRGCPEALLALTVAPVYDGFGDIVLGPSAILRYNFVQPDCRLVPYIQCGAGLVYTDGYKDQAQRAIGQAVEFYLHAGLGLRWLFKPNWSLDAEASYQHISNADLAPRNGGINSVGGSAGLTYYFPRPRR